MDAIDYSTLFDLLLDQQFELWKLKVDESTEQDLNLQERECLDFVKRIRTSSNVSAQYDDAQIVEQF